MQFKKIFTVALLATLLVGCGGLSEIDAKYLAEQFINDNLVSGGLSAKVLNIEEESGLWNLDVELSDGRKVKSLMSLDGKIFVPEAIYIEEVEAAVAAEQEALENAQQETLASIPKTEKPVVELFVMSYCPFGTQAEKAMIPALEALGDSIDFQLKFVNYAMHYDQEIDENMRQYAISQDYPEKLLPYLKEFLTAGDSVASLVAVGLSEDDLAATMAAADEQYQVAENLNNQDLWLKDAAGNSQYPLFNINNEDNLKYGVEGSPTIVINGQPIEKVQRTPAVMLETICAGFENAPKSCSTELSTATTSSGFGWDQTEGAASGGECS
ncbi:MAG: hypothetical protein K9L85_01295 [Candidatus Peribacteraceae bacterium]|nr:hypothetical protein [Candidatus Peribacteraceae bacterium]